MPKASFAHSARWKKRLDKKEPSLRGAILDCVYQMLENPRHPGLRTHPVQGAPGVFEAYVDKANRVTWEWDPDEPDTIRFRNHCNHDIVRRSP